MLLDAIVLAGGRSSRLGGVPKQHLLVGGRSLLQRTLDAALAAGAQRIVVVGEAALAAEVEGAVGGADATAAGGADAGVAAGAGAGAGASGCVGRDVVIVVVREEPAFGGPAAAIAAGVSALGGDFASARDASSPGFGVGGRGILVLACDMPGCAGAVSALVGAAREAAAGSRGDRKGGDGFVAVDASGRRQHLLALYSASALDDAVRRAGSRLDGLAVRTLVEQLDLREVPVPAGAADDVDTWDDAERLGARPSPDRRSPDEC